MPAPLSARSNTGTSLWASSRITASTGRMLALAPSMNWVTTASITISELKVIGGSSQRGCGLPIFPLPSGFSNLEPQSIAWYYQSTTLAELRSCHPWQVRSAVILRFQSLRAQLVCFTGETRGLRLPLGRYAAGNTRKNFSHFHCPPPRANSALDFLSRPCQQDSSEFPHRYGCNRRICHVMGEILRQSRRVARVKIGV